MNVDPHAARVVEDIGLMEVLGWGPEDFQVVTPRYRAECLFYLHTRREMHDKRKREEKQDKELLG